MNLQTIPIKVSQTGTDTYLAEVDVEVDGHTKTFLLDTGAASSALASDTHTQTYPSLGKDESRGASGNAKVCDIVQPRKIEIGQHFFSKTRIKRCDRNILGIDLLGEFIFEIDLKKKELNILSEFPKNRSAQSVRRLTPGHLTIPLQLGNTAVDALFDSGADTTVIDSQFIKQHPESFELVRADEGEDAHGNKIPSHVYRCISVQVGHLHLKNVEMATFDWGGHLREKMEGSPIILGNNVISKARWIFDLKSGRWTSEENHSAAGGAL